MNYDLYEPKSFEEAKACADSLLKGNGAVLNLHRLDRATAQRFIDFLTGCVYTLHGKIQMGGTNVVIVVPNEGDIQGNIEF